MRLVTVCAAAYARNSLAGCMRKMRVTHLLIAATIVAGGCTLNEEPIEFYVLTPAPKAAQFTQDLAAVTQRYGLRPDVGQVSDAQGRTTRVLHARGRGLRVWSENVSIAPLEEGPECGRHDQVYPDPGQYLVAVSAVPQFGNRPAGKRKRQQAAELKSRLAVDLGSMGYEIHSTSLVCSPLARNVP